MRKFATVFTIMGLLYVLSAFFGQAELYAQTAGASSGSLANALSIFWNHTGFSSVNYKYLDRKSVV